MLPLEVFWTSLVGLDAAVVGLLLANRRRADLLDALVVMVVDVAANAYALFLARMPFQADRLVLQALFLGYVLGSIPFLWRAPEPSSRRRR